MTVCAKCDQVHDRCKAHTRAGNPCRQKPMHGQKVCRMHGGQAPRSLAAAARRLQEADVAERLAELLTEHGRDPASIDPASELLAILADTLAMRSVLHLLVSQLAPVGTPAYVEYPIGDDDSGAKVGQPTYRPAEPAGIYGPDHKGDGKPHVLMVMLADWSDRAAKQAKLAIDAGIDERRVQIVEAQAEQLGQVVRAICTGLIGEAVRIWGDDARRQLDSVLPGIIRTAIESSGVIDVDESGGR